MLRSKTASIHRPLLAAALGLRPSSADLGLDNVRRRGLCLSRVTLSGPSAAKAEANGSKPAIFSVRYKAREVGE
jgi:hypothetical protein